MLFKKPKMLLLQLLLPQKQLFKVQMELPSDLELVVVLLLCVQPFIAAAAERIRVKWALNIMKEARNQTDKAFSSILKKHEQPWNDVSSYFTLRLF